MAKRRGLVRAAGALGWNARKQGMAVRRAMVEALEARCLLATTPEFAVDLVGAMGGATHASEVVGNTVYTATGSQFRILDVSTPSNPVCLGQVVLNGEVQFIAVAGSYAYVAADAAGLQIINISNPAAPTLAGKYDTPGSASSVSVSGSYAYVADYDSGLQIINISNPAVPTLVGSYDTPGYASGVSVSGSYAYVADGSVGLQIINISNPAAPTLAGSYDTPSSAQGVRVSGSYAYVADYSSGLQIINISNPSAATLTGSYNTPGSARDVTLSGSYAYVADGLFGLQIINISNPAAPTLAGSRSTFQETYGVSISGSYAYVAAWDAGLQVVNISNPATPTLVSSYTMAGSGWGVSVSGSYAYVAGATKGLQVINVSNPAALTLAGSYDTAGSTYGVSVVGSYAYLADGNAGLQIINISNPAVPTLAGSYNTPGYARSVSLSGTYAYVADDTYGLQIIDISNPAAPTLVGSYDTPGNAYGVSVSGSYAYVADRDSGLLIINIGNPATPTLTGSYNTVGSAYGVSISGSYAYVADGFFGLQIINISNPAAPTLAGSYFESGGCAFGLRLSGLYAYVADSTRGLQIINIGNPAAPTLAGSYDTAGAAYDVSVVGSYVYLANEYAGLQILHVTNLNRAPTNITLYGGNVAENQPSGTMAGILIPVDPDTGDVFTFTLVSGTGSTDNGLFQISGALLQTAASFNYEAASSYSIRVRLTDRGGLWFEKVFTISVNNVNEAPTNVTLTPGSVAENQPTGTAVGTFTTADPDIGSTFTYTLVSGTGGDDNAAFTISGNTLKTAAVFDYETKSSYSIRVRTTDAGGLFFEKVLAITVILVGGAPTDIGLSSSSVAENQASGVAVGILSTTDPDAGEIFTYSLVSGTGSTDNASFSISGSQLLTAASFNYEARNSYSIRIRTTDQGGLWFEKVFTISVTNINEAPTNLILAGATVVENCAIGTSVERLWTSDQDVGDSFSYSLVSGSGSTDNAAFTISGDHVYTAAPMDFEAKSSYSIRVRTTDRGGLWFEKAFTISVLNMAEFAPTITGISSDTGISSNDGITNDPTLLINGTSEPYMTITVYRDGTLAGTMMSDGWGHWSFDYTGTSLADGSYSFTATSSDWNGHVTAPSAPYAVSVDTSVPKVMAVYVKGSTWNTNYLTFLAANLAGASATYGYAIPVGTGASQLQTLPWRNLNRISIAFSEDVSVSQAQFAIVGSVGSYSVSSFSYSSADHVATWSLSAAMGPDKLYVALPGRGTTPVTDAAGNTLDGEWTNPSSYSDAGVTSSFPSGDGLAGGNFAFRLDVLPGDSTGGSLGKVNVADVLQTKGRSSLPVSTSSYRSDFDGNDLVNVADVLYAKSKSSIYSLPTMPPLPPTFGLVFGAMASQVSLLQKDRLLRLW